MALIMHLVYVQKEEEISGNSLTIKKMIVLQNICMHVHILQKNFPPIWYVMRQKFRQIEAPEKSIDY